MSLSVSMSVGDCFCIKTIGACSLCLLSTRGVKGCLLSTGAADASLFAIFARPSLNLLIFEGRASPNLFSFASKPIARSQ